MAKYLKQNKKDVFETLKLIMISYDNNVLYLMQNKEKAMNETCRKYYDFFEWLQKIETKPKKVNPKKIYLCEVCGKELEIGCCVNKECICSTPYVP